MSVRFMWPPMVSRLYNEQGGLSLPACDAALPRIEIALHSGLRSHVIGE